MYMTYTVAFSESTEKQCVKRGLPTRKPQFDLCSIARPCQH